MRKYKQDPCPENWCHNKLVSWGRYLKSRMSDMKNVKLVESMFGISTWSMHGSVRSAARDACRRVAFNMAAPVRIEIDGKIVWENTGPFDGSYEKLRELAGYDE